MSAATATWPAFRAVIERRARWALSAERRDRTCAVVLCAAMAAYAVLAMYLTRQVGLFVDGVQLFTQNRGLDVHVLLAPLNGHLVLMERSVYAAGFALFGANFVVFRLIETAGTLLAVALLFAYLRRRTGAILALPLCVLVLFLGSAWEVTIVPDVMTNTWAAAAGVGALLALDREDRGGDILACALLAASIACWTLGLAFAVAAAIRLALERRFTRLWTAAAPLALYGAWLVWIRVATLPDHVQPQHLPLSNALLIPSYLANEAAAVAGSVAGLNHDFSAAAGSFAPFSTDLTWGIPLAFLAGAALLYRLRRAPAGPALWGAIAGLATFWAILAIGFGLGRSPTTVRYVYPGAVLGLLVTGEALRGARLRAWVPIAVAAATVLALGTNLYRLRDGARYLRDYSANQRAQFSAIEIARRSVSPTFTVRSVFPIHLTARAYLAAVARNGSPAFTLAELEAQPEAVRETADSTLVSALGIHLAAPPAAERPSGCRRYAPSGQGPIVVRARAPGLVVRSGAPASVAMGRFADQPSATIGAVTPGKATALRIPPDALGRAPWTVATGTNGRPIRICVLTR